MKVVPSVLFSAMSGSSGDVTAATNKGRQYVRRRVIPANPNSVDQQAQRTAFTRVLECYQGLSTTIKTFLAILAGDAQWTKSNVYQSTNTKLERDSFTHPIIGPNRYCDAVVGLAAASGAGAAGTAVITWTTTGWTASFVPIILARLRNGAGPTFATPWVNLAVGAATMATGTCTVTGLIASSNYQFALIPKEDATDYIGGGMNAACAAHA